MQSNINTKTPKIRVLVRKRPLSKKQHLKGEEDIIEVQNSQSVIVREQKYKVDLTPFIDQYKFLFDGAYDEKATNQQIYLTSVRPLVDCAFDGARVSCFAYGQTGSGKTYTMLGDMGQNVRGLYLLAANDIFQNLDSYEISGDSNSNSNKLSVWISFYEIYCGKLYDLLNQRNLLYARQDAKNNVNIVGLSERKIVSVQNLMQIIEFGTGVRVTAQNGTNVDSSRSHAILQIVLKKNNTNKIHGKISFIDLAGSERAADHADQLEKQTRIDGAQINKSLLALKECIRALDQNKNHTPFRGSKLTMVLKDSFTGYCRTVMIGNISPNSSSCQNTLNTLKYADRVKELKRSGGGNSGALQQQMMQVDSLSRELMLPRAMINNTRKYNDQSQERHHSNLQEHAYEERAQSKNTRKQLQQPYINQPPLFNSKPTYHSSMNNNYMTGGNPQPLYTNNNINNNHINSSPYGKQSKKMNSNLPHYGLVQQQQPQNNNLGKNNSNGKHKYPNTVGQNNYGTNNMETFEELAQKHQNYIQLIIQQQEQLMKSHQQHINNSIQLVKQEMFLMGQADKIGSNIEDYLNNLQDVLQKELSSIYSVRDKVRKMKKDLKESQRIEKRYLEEADQMQGCQEDILLDDDEEHLF